MLKKEFTHQLEESFRYSANGNFNDAEIITVSAPKSSNFYENLQFLDCLCNKAELRTMKNIAGVLNELKVTDAEKEKAEKEKNELSDNEKAINAYNQLFAGLEREEISQLNVVIVELLKKSAFVDGEKKFEEQFWEDMSIEDRRLLIGKYIENFTVTAQRNSKKQ